MIEIDESIVKKDGANVTFPVDNTGRPTAMLVGFDENEAIRPVRINSSGKLMVDSSVTVDGVTLGEVGITAEDVSGTVGVVNRIQNSGSPITSSLMTQDTRMTFSQNELNSLAYGQNSGVNYPLSVDATGKLNVNVSSSSTSTVQSADSMFATAPTVTTDASADLMNMSCRHLLNKTVVIKNSGANSASVSIAASVDAGSTFAIPLVTSYEVVAGATYVYSHDSAVTNIKISAKSYVAGSSTVVGVTAYAMGA